MTRIECAETELFARIHHRRECLCRIYDDELSARIIEDGDYGAFENRVIEPFTQLAGLDSKTGREKALRVFTRSVEQYVLARDAFRSDALATAVRIGCRQYLDFFAGYDTYACRAEQNLRVFEFEASEVFTEKERLFARCRLDYGAARIPFFDRDGSWRDRAEAFGYDRNALSFCDLCGVCDNSEGSILFLTLNRLSGFVCTGSSVVFDTMRTGMDYIRLENTVSMLGWRIYEVCGSHDLEERFFRRHNSLEREDILTPPADLTCVLAVRK